MHKLGKLTNDELDGLILSRIRHTRPEVVVRPHIGEDCAALVLAASYACSLPTPLLRRIRARGG